MTFVFIARTESYTCWSFEPDWKTSSGSDTFKILTSKRSNFIKSNYSTWQISFCITTAFSEGRKGRAIKTIERIIKHAIVNEKTVQLQSQSSTVTKQIRAKASKGNHIALVQLLITINWNNLSLLQLEKNL